MFGKSYDGTFSNGVAATGVEGLTTIVPISAISEWYDYSRSNGLRQSQAGTHYPASLSSTITSNTSAANLGVAPPSNNASCASSRAAMSLVDGDTDGNVNQFWEDRNYNNDVANVKASVFAVHGLNDDNVKTDRSASGGRASRRITSRARSGSAWSDTSTRSTSGATSGWTRSTAGTTTGSRASTTGSWTSRGR